MITPGPGTYEDGRALESEVHKRTMGKQGTFGCTEKRFAPKAGGQSIEMAVDTPGPGQYI